MPNRGTRRIKGEGSVYQRNDGRWTAAITLEDGRRKHVYAKTKQEVIDKLAQIRNQQIDNIPFTDERLTVGQWLDVWLRNTRPPHTKPKTWITYEGLVRLHLKPALGSIPLVKLMPQHVRDFLNGALDAGLSPRTVKHLRGTLRAALNQAINDDLIQRNVAAKTDPPEVEQRELDVYSPGEARLLLQAVAGHRLEDLFAAAIGLGLREGECMGLQWSSIDFEKGCLTVNHTLQRVKRLRRGDVVREGEPKTERLLGRPKGKKPRKLNLPRIVLEAFLRHRGRQREERLLAGSAWKGESGYVFTSRIGTPLEQRALDREFHSLREAAGLRRIRFHDLRHSAVSILIAQGVHPKAIQELLGHASFELTMTVYGHLFDQVQRQTAERMDEALRPDRDKLSDKLSDDASGPVN